MRLPCLSGGGLPQGERSRSGARPGGGTSGTLLPRGQAPDARLAVPSPLVAGLSHLSHQLEKIGVVPGGAHHLSADRILFTVCAQSIAADSANQGKIFRAVILAGTALILLEDHVEAPVKSILDVPVTAPYIEDIAGAHAKREDVEPSLLLALVLDDAHALHLRDCEDRKSVV